ncbi:MAG TPA: hypothetical protein PK447_07645 [Ignavibacteria bacterium]|nr:hypothetical protein [Ignavibacteria bacterium]
MKRFAPKKVDTAKDEGDILFLNIHNRKKNQSNLPIISLTHTLSATALPYIFTK